MKKVFTYLRTASRFILKHNLSSSGVQQNMPPLPDYMIW